MKIRTQQSGVTLIELMVVLVIIGILGTILAMTYSGIQAKNRNTTRQDNIQALQRQLEIYYAQTSKYPTLANLNDTNWRAANTKDLPKDALQDPRWSKDIKDCTVNDNAVLIGTLAANCYAYQVTGVDGSACNNATVDCAHFALTATLEGGDKYVKSSLN
ncbi:MAG TPA: type II secretion system protein [Nevskiaceae bacterium]|nr:type II secretion system protein [Nevskiaceae bacterium]